MIAHLPAVVVAHGVGEGCQGVGINAQRLVAHGLRQCRRPRSVLGVVVVVLAPAVVEDCEQQYRVGVGPLAMGHEQPVLGNAPPVGVAVDAISVSGCLESRGDGRGDGRCGHVAHQSGPAGRALTRAAAAISPPE